MKPEERKTIVFTILGKTLLNIVAVALTFAVIILAWEKYDWLPFVKNIIRGVVIPILLGGLLVFLLRHKVDAMKDKWKPFVMFVIFLTGTLVFVNAGIIVREACSKVVKVDSITTLSNEEIKRADYLLIESIEPDTSSCNYLFDAAVIHSRRGSDHIRFLLYQACPLKNKKGVFLCTRTKETHPYGTISENRLQQWKTDFVNREGGSIKRVAPSAHFFKVLHQSDHFEQYQTIAATCNTRHGVISPEHQILLEIRQPDTIKRWEDNVLYIFLSLLVGFSVLAITLMGKGILNEGFRDR
ncbi:MAG: hypothetical protein IKH88_14895 [Prevotella sp.]|nr:hypothetical protein [Prevotella sp.]